MKKLVKVLGVMVVVTAFGAAAVTWRINHEVTQTRTVRHVLDMRGKGVWEGRPLTFVQLSDFHNLPRPGQVDQVLREVDQAFPQLVLITGDLVNTTNAGFAPLEQLMAGLAAQGRPVYVVWGNHDHWSRQLDRLTEIVTRHGATVLTNESRVLTTRGGNRYNLVGVDDYSDGHGDLSKAMKGVDTSLFTLVMSHAPEIRRDLPGSGVDLAIVGHTHGGQVALPLIGCLYAPNQGRLPTYCRGFHTVDQTTLYIDSGIGTTSKEVRFGVQSQITSMTIRLF